MYESHTQPREQVNETIFCLKTKKVNQPIAGKKRQWTKQLDHVKQTK